LKGWRGSLLAAKKGNGHSKYLAETPFSPSAIKAFSEEITTGDDLKYIIETVAANETIFMGGG